VSGRHARGSRGWEGAVELAAVVTLAIPTSLILFFADWVWRDEWAGGVFLAAFTLPPAAALWLVGLSRGAGSGGRGFRLAPRAAGLRGLRRERRSAADADPGQSL